MIEKHIRAQALGDSMQEEEGRVDLKRAVLTGTQEGLTDLSKYAVMGLVAAGIGWFVLGRSGMKKFVGKVR